MILLRFWKIYFSTPENNFLYPEYQQRWRKPWTNKINLEMGTIPSHDLCRLEYHTCSTNAHQNTSCMKSLLSVLNMLAVHWFKGCLQEPHDASQEQCRQLGSICKWQQHGNQERHLAGAWGIRYNIYESLWLRIQKNVHSRF